MFNFKELLALIGLLLVIGIVGIMYRTVMERSATTGNGQAICSPDTRTCANGTVEKRLEPACTFAVCPRPAEQVIGTTTLATSTTTTTKNTATSTQSIFLSR